MRPNERAETSWTCRASYGVVAAGREAGAGGAQRLERWSSPGQRRFCEELQSVSATVIGTHQSSRREQGSAQPSAVQCSRNDLHFPPQPPLPPVNASSLPRRLPPLALLLTLTHRKREGDPETRFEG